MLAHMVNTHMLSDDMVRYFPKAFSSLSNERMDGVFTQTDRYTRIPQNMHPSQRRQLVTFFIISARFF